MTIISKCAAALLVGVGAGFVAAEPPSPPEAKVPPQKAAAPMLEGTYTLVSGERDGKPIPAEQIKGSLVAFTGDKIVGTDKDKKEFFAASYTLDATKTPCVIRMKGTSPKELDAAGIVKKDGDTLMLAYALPGGDVPTEFKTKDKQHLFVLKAMKKEPVPPKP